MWWYKLRYYHRHYQDRLPQGFTDRPNLYQVAISNRKMVDITRRFRTVRDSLNFWKIKTMIFTRSNDQIPIEIVGFRRYSFLFYQSYNQRII